ncbi:tetratricopeptide repeat protein [Streptomyces triticirhizae]|uniref:AAA+ ATPase domain-containing protein n=1 Tax=Streptomyces triticirhizae TaxID=2483353 RepID=A0A3M2MC62_9ACTN|nr:tetratricopeptide repeat protein [Streptomyces triticirhizae]RMI43261.1 hypothetical protein EBN88_07655 [Streptomyces triticirhizae]RMI44788.1 hypothetical protein EBN88_04655 [Streptomyces triticirhizae]
MVYQVPPETAHFVDREEEQARAFRAVSEWKGASRPLCLALSGLGGTGKTELAYRLARTLRDRYPDGVLHVDLDDLRRDGAVEVTDALGQLLAALDVEGRWLDRTLRDRSRQYWDRTDGRRLIVLIDNARTAAEVVPLLPASGDSLVIVASHGPLYDLESGSAVELPLAPLADRDATELLRLIVDDPRLVEEPEAVGGLLRLCSGLPAALLVAGRWMRRHRRRPLARLLAELDAQLTDRGLPMIEAVWDAAYRSLDENAALLYRLVPLFPGGSFTAEGAAALLGRGREAADDALDALETAGLLDPRGQRTRLPDLLRAHAERRSREDGDEEERRAAATRAVRWYLRQAQRADLLAAGPRLTLAAPAGPVPGAPDVEFGEGRPSDAHRWLEAERHALHGSVALALRLGLHAECWALGEPLWTHFLDHPHHAETAESFGLAIEAAQRDENPPALVRMRSQLARVHWERGEFDEASEQLTQAQATAALLGDGERDRKLAASVVEFRGTLHGRRGDWQSAAADFAEARRAHRAIDNAYGVLLGTYRLGEALAALGELDRAEELLAQARAGAEERGRERIAARAAFALAGVLRRQGRAAEARPLYEAALAAARARGADWDEARVLRAYADLAEEQGERAEAAQLRAAAQAIEERRGAAAG